MLIFVKMNGKLASVFIRDHGWFVIAKSDLELVTGGSYIL